MGIRVYMLLEDPVVNDDIVSFLYHVSRVCHIGITDCVELRLWHLNLAFAVLLFLIVINSKGLK
jgi:Ni,Fe-hydrogenase I cytochrome b subunit